MDNGGGGGGGCCIARYRGGEYHDISTIDRIMMKFRPIAPKPANGNSSSPEMSETSSGSSRGKKRLNGHGIRRCNKYGRNNGKRKTLTGDEAVVTLPLLPETPERKTSPIRESQIGKRETKNLSTWLSFGRKDDCWKKTKQQVIGSSCVTVECVTDVDEIGCTDGERRMNLERDRCPGFITDGYGRVTWKNEAYKEMVVRDGEGEEEVVVWLVLKDKGAVLEALASKEAFTCRVRVQNKTSCGYGNEKSSLTLPCDVWRMDAASFAWRLDLTAALSLGR